MNAVHDKTATGGRMERIMHCAGLVEARIEAWRPGWRPEIAVILGTGLQGFDSRAEGALRIPYREVGLPGPGVEGHSGVLVLGAIRGRRVAILSGRVHFYEGHSMDEVVLGVRVLHQLGAGTVLISNSAGLMNPALGAGNLMALTDHINFMGTSPLRGPNLDELGPRFPDMTRVYDPGLRATMTAAAGKLSIGLREGVYVGFGGPMYETPAEIRAFRTLGADAVGMSTVPEATAARHMGMRVAAVSCLTNLAAGLADGLLSHDDVTQAGETMGMRLAALFEEVIGMID